MAFDSIIYRANGTSSLFAWRGARLKSVREHALDQVESGSAVRVAIYENQNLIAHYPRTMRPA